MLLISSADAFEAVELLPLCFSKTLCLLILRKRRNKLGKAELSRSTSGTGLGAGGTWRHLLVLPCPAGCFIPFFKMCLNAFSLHDAACRSSLSALFHGKGQQDNPKGRV